MSEPVVIGSATLHQGDCLEVLRGMADCSVDAVVTDPPAGISFMGKAWDHHKGGRDAWVAWMTEIAAEVHRVLKPGGHALVWAIPRTSHWTATAWEDAGFEVRDRIAHCFGSGFPKSMDVSKALDKMAGVEREIIGVKPGHEGFANRGNLSSVQSFKGTLGGDKGFSRPWMEDPEKVERYHMDTAPATEAAKQYAGYGTALKPAVEDWWLLRKPLDGTVAGNMLKWGVGGLNIDASRIPSGKDHADKCASVVGLNSNRNGSAYGEWQGERTDSHSALGRWPANLIHSGEEEVVRMFPVDRKKATGAPKVSSGKKTGSGTWAGSGMQREGAENTGIRDHGDSGSASRFFKTCPPDIEGDRLVYVPKASKADRDSGGVRSTHPTVKPESLMRYLCRLICPPGGTVADFFMGSGSTGKAAMIEGFKFIGVERESEYFEIACARIEAAQNGQQSLDLEPAA